MSTPRILFGAGGIGDTEKSFTHTWTTPEDVSSMLSSLKALGLNELDSAASYPPTNPWNTETLLGQAKAASKGFVIDTKILVNPEFKNFLGTDAIESSIDKSLDLLGVGKVRVLYAHAADSATPAKETAAAFDKQYKAGKFEKLGLSNYTTEQMEEYLDVCDANGYVKPSVYQGHYNALYRNDEESMMPVLRKHGIGYNAYSPLAGGFLTGKITFKEELRERSRWSGPSAMSFYGKLFDKPVVHDAIKALNSKCEAHDIALGEASLRWILHHSALRPTSDGLILGASRITQLEGNMAQLRKGPLPEAIVQGMEEMWQAVKADSKSKL